MMADEKHLELLLTCAGAWKKWRAGNRNLKPDLEEADLGGLDLSGVDLGGVDLGGADLSKADLSGANLCGAYLRSADLSRADLSGADLSVSDLGSANLSRAKLCGAELNGAYLTDADLNGANLYKVDLRGTILRLARLSEADISGAYIGETIFADIDLTSIKGLDSCKHGAPSIVDNRTMARSENVPINFWYGCGVPDWQIEATKLSQPGLTQDDIISIVYEVARIRGEQPIQLFRPFISHSSQDDAFTRKLYDGLQNNGVRCWYAPEDMKIGDRIRSRIDEVIHIYDKLLLVLSEHSVASQWVEQEVETALEKERETGEMVLFPIKVDDAIDGMKTGWPALVRKTRHIGDFSNWHDDEAFHTAFDRVLRDLRATP